MQGDARIWILSVALTLSGCAKETLDGAETQSLPRPTPTSDGNPYGVTPPNTGHAGSAALLGKAGASFGGAAGNAGSSAGAGGSAGSSSAAGAGGSAGANSLAAGAGAAGMSAGTGEGGSSAASGGTSTNSGSTSACPSLTRVKLANGTCVDRVSEFSVANRPTNIVTGADGRIWFDDEGTHKIVQLDEEGRALAQIVCDASSAPRALVGGKADAILWYSDAQAKTVVKLTADLQRTAFAVGFAPSALALGENDELFLSESAKGVYRLRPSESSITKWPCEPSNSLVFGPDKNLWFQEGVQIARLIPDLEKRDFSITDSFANDLCVGPDKALWFVDGALHQVGRMELDGTFTRTYDLPVGTGPFRIITGPDAALWFTERGANKIGRIDVDGAITHYPIPTSAAAPYALTVGADHNIWFTETLAGKIGRLIPESSK
ncbi:MAG TPA: hypothetical protein VER12_03750 [Polyangiaceae bacterium]|nr:hypothetical protein [Polyangiaceae bacterium]